MTFHQLYSCTWFLVLYHVKPQCLIWTQCAVIEVETERWWSSLSSWYGNRPLPLFSASERDRIWVWCSGFAGVLLCTAFFSDTLENPWTWTCLLLMEKWNEVMGELLKCCTEKCQLEEAETLLNATVARGCLYHAVHCIAVTVLWKLLQTAIKETFTPFYINLHKWLPVPVSCRAYIYGCK